MKDNLPGSSEAENQTDTDPSTTTSPKEPPFYLYPSTGILRADGRVEHPALGEDVVLYDGDRVVAYT